MVISDILDGKCEGWGMRDGMRSPRSLLSHPV